MGFYYNQQPGFYYNQQPGFYYNQQPGFYYNQEKPGFYYDGFYYDGFYYDQQDGFYYDGFYYESDKQEGFYYDGFYYDQQDKFNKANKDYWYKGDGKKRMVKALNGLRTMVDDHVTKNPHAANETQGRALSNVVTVKVVREVIAKFCKNVDPNVFMENGGDAKKLAVLLASECKNVLGPEKDFRKKWREPGSEYNKAMNKVTKELVPFMVQWKSKTDKESEKGILPPNAVQDAACMNVVAERLIDEAFYKYACENDPSKLSKNKDKQQKQIIFIAKKLTDHALGIVEAELQGKN